MKLPGFLYDLTGDYEVAFWVAGITIAAAGVICLPLRVFRRCEGADRRRNGEHAITLSEEELEDMAQRLKNERLAIHGSLSSSLFQLNMIGTNEDLRKSNVNVKDIELIRDDKLSCSDTDLLTNRVASV